MTEAQIFWVALVSLVVLGALLLLRWMRWRATPTTEDLLMLGTSATTLVGAFDLFTYAFEKRDALGSARAVMIILMSFTLGVFVLREMYRRLTRPVLPGGPDRDGQEREAE